AAAGLPPAPGLRGPPSAGLRGATAGGVRTGPARVRPAGPGVRAARAGLRAAGPGPRPWARQPALAADPVGAPRLVTTSPAAVGPGRRRLPTRALSSSRPPCT